jgi:hypothetical protein
MGRLMQSWGLVSTSGKPFAPQSLYQIFTNPFYAGILVDPWTGEEHEGKHVAMVSPTEFARVQAVIARRNRSAPHRKNHPDFPLRGFVRCDGCGGEMTGGSSRGRSRAYPYYSCHHHVCGKHAKSYPAGDIEREFTMFLDEIAPRPQLIEELGERIIKAADTEKREGFAKQKQRHRRTTDLARENQELIRMRAQNLISDDEFLDQKKRLREQQLAVEAHDEQRIDADRVRRD